MQAADFLDDQETLLQASAATAERAFPMHMAAPNTSRSAAPQERAHSCARSQPDADRAAAHAVCFPAASPSSGDSQGICLRPACGSYSHHSQRAQRAQHAAARTNMDVRTTAPMHATRAASVPLRTAAAHRHTHTEVSPALPSTPGR